MMLHRNVGSERAKRQLMLDAVQMSDDEIRQQLAMHKKDNDSSWSYYVFSDEFNRRNLTETSPVVTQKKLDAALRVYAPRKKRTPRVTRLPLPKISGKRTTYAKLGAKTHRHRALLHHSAHINKTIFSVSKGNLGDGLENGAAALVEPTS